MNGRIKREFVPAEVAAPVSETPRRTLTEVGRVSIGEKDPQRGFPRSVDYFIIRGQFAGLVRNIYGEKPTELPILFYSDDFNEVCSERFELRDTAGKLLGYGDGETFRFYEVRTGDYTAVRTVSENPAIMTAMLDFVKSKAEPSKRELIRWAHTLTIRFVIKDVPVLGYWQFTSKGIKTTIPNLRDAFDNCLATLGTVRFFPFTLTVRKVKSNKPGDSRQYPVVDIVPAFSLETGLQLAQYLQENPHVNQARLALVADLNKVGQNPVKLLNSGE